MQGDEVIEIVYSTDNILASTPQSKTKIQNMNTQWWLRPLLRPTLNKSRLLQTTVNNLKFIIILGG